MVDILQDALDMLEKHPLCDHCLGRQFALLGHGIENNERGKSLKLALVLKLHAAYLSGKKSAPKTLGVLSTNGLSPAAAEVLLKIRKSKPKKGKLPAACFLCENHFNDVERLADSAVLLLQEYDYRNFLVGVELPLSVEEREDEFKAEFEVAYGEDLRNEFGRLIGKAISEKTGKPAEFLKPEIVVLVNPFAEEIKLQINPLFVAGRYRKLVRGIPQSKWFCSACRGKGCEKCGWTGKMYPESVEEIIGKKILEETGGSDLSFHAAGREDIDARMLGTGRPFVIEISRPRKRSLDFGEMEKAVNLYGAGKVEVSDLALVDKEAVRRLKRGESSQKEYRVIIEFENRISQNDLREVKKRLTNALIEQKTPIRVLHRRADLKREKYIYEVDVRKLSPKKGEMNIRCQGGLYVKELVTGDEGRTMPNVSDILKNRARPLKLDVLSVIM